MTRAQNEEELFAEALSVLQSDPRLADLTAQLRPTVLSRRFLPDSARIVLRLGEDQNAFVFKYQSGATYPEHFRKEVAAHQFAFDTLGANHVPELLLADDGCRWVLSRYVDAKSVHEMLELAEFGLASAPDIMRRSGAWLAGYHSATKQPGRAFKPDAMMRWAEDMRQSVLHRDVDVPRRDLYLKYADQLPEIAEKARGKHTPVAASHGDFHLRNLLIKNDHVYGIDFAPKNFVPPAHDLAKFLLRYQIWFDGPESEAAVAAFWQGYGGQDEVCAAYSLLFPIQLLGDWRKMPKKRDDRSAGQQRQFRGLLKLAQRQFAP